MTTTIRPHTRRKRDSDRRYANRMARAQRATWRRLPPRDTPLWYYRDGRPIVASDRTVVIRVHSALLNDRAYRTVAFSRFGEGYSVSTVWVGADMSHYGTTPLIFETLALVDGHEVEMRHPTERLARISHYSLARLVEAAYRLNVTAAELDVTAAPVTP